MQLIRPRLRHHIHVNAADGHGSRGVVGDNLKLIERVVIGIKLSVAAARPRPVQIEAVEAVNLFCLGASMDLHRGLLVAVVAGYIEGARCYPGHLRGGGPRVAPARNVLQQGLVKRR